MSNLIFAAGGLAVTLAFGMWAGDYLGRKYPTQWAALRAGLKSAGDAARKEE